MKKEKNKKRVQLILGVVSWILMMSLLWLIEYRFYRGCLNSGFVYYLFMTMLLWIDWLFQSDEKEAERKCSRFNIFFEILIVGIVLTVSIVLMWNVILYNIKMFQVILLLLCVLVLKVFERINQKQILKNLGKSMSIAIICNTISFASILFCLVFHPMTYGQAREMLIEKGYQNVEYSRIIKDDEYIEMLYQESEIILPESHDEFHYYLFYCEKDGVKRDVIVSLYDRAIVAEKKIH